MSLLSAIAGLLRILAALFKAGERETAKAEGAAIQREHDMRIENERIAKASRAVDDVRSGGGVPIDQDPNNRITASPVPPVCTVWRAISYSAKSDTAETVSEVRAGNAARKSYCGGLY